MHSDPVAFRKKKRSSAQRELVEFYIKSGCKEFLVWNALDKLLAQGSYERMRDANRLIEKFEELTRWLVWD